MRSVAGLTNCALLVVALAWPTNQRVFSGLIAGTVVDGITGRSITGAVVSLSAAPGSGPEVNWAAVAPRTLVDDRGRFVFAGLPPGRYGIAASRPGFITGQYGQEQPSSSARRLELTDGERVTSVQVRMFPFASLSGTVLDELGEPAGGVTIQIWRRQVNFGRYRWAVAGAGGLRTDDRGAFCAGDLQPGEYILGVRATTTSVPLSVAGETQRGLRDAPGSVTPRTTLPEQDLLRIGSFVLTGPVLQSGPELGSIAVYRPAFHRNASSVADATAVSLRSGDALTGIEIRLQPERARRITGSARSAEGPVKLTSVRLFSTDSDTLLSTRDAEVASALTDAAGEFTLFGVPIGTYELRIALLPPVPQADAPSSIELARSEQPALWASERVTIEERDVEITVAVRQGVRVQGRLEFEGASSPPPPGRLPRLALRLEPADQLVSVRAFVDGQRGFRSMSALPGKYFLRADSVDGWRLKSVHVEGRDLFEQPLELGSADVSNVVLTFSDRRWATIHGNVTTADRQPTPEVMVVAFPTDRLAWTDFGISPARLVSARTSSGGAYELQALPPGEYYVAAVSLERTGGRLPDRWDAGLFDAVSRVARRQRVAFDENLAINLQAVAPR